MSINCNADFLFHDIRSSVVRFVYSFLRFVDAALTQIEDFESENIRPDRLHSVVSISVRMLGRLVSQCPYLFLIQQMQKTLFNWESLVPSQQSYGLASEPQVDRFKKKFTLIVILTECVERFIFGKISRVIFGWLVEHYRCPPPNETRTTPAPSRRIFRNIFASFSSSVATHDLRPSRSEFSPIVRGRAILGKPTDEASSSCLSSAIAKLSNRMTSDSSQCQTVQRAVEFVRKKLSKLDDMMVRLNMIYMMLMVRLTHVMHIMHIIMHVLSCISCHACPFCLN